MASGAAAAGGPAAEQPWPMRCTACNASLGTGALVVIVVPLKTGVGRHAFTGTYDGYGACETTAGERVHMLQFQSRWREWESWDFELRFTPAATEVVCASGCYRSTPAPVRALRELRETLSACRDAPKLAGGGAGAAAAAQPARAAVAKPAARPAAAAAAPPHVSISDEDEPVAKPTTRGAKREGEAAAGAAATKRKK